MSSINTQFGYNFVISVIISAGGRLMRGVVDTFPQNCYNSNDAATRSAVVTPVSLPEGGDANGYIRGAFCVLFGNYQRHCFNTRQ